MTQDGMSSEHIRALLQEAAHAGAAEALAAVGLSDKDAAQDVRDLRTLLQAYREAKRTAAKTVVRRVVDLFITSCILGLIAYFAGIRIGG